MIGHEACETKRPPMPSSLDLDRQLCHSVYSCANALVRAYRPVLEPLGLTYPQYLVMLSLWEQDGISIRQLGAHTRFDSGSLTPILKRLEDKGLLRREPSRQDERQKTVVLTETGRELRHRAEKVPEYMTCSYGFELEKARQLKALSEELHRLLESGPEPRD